MKRTKCNTNHLGTMTNTSQLLYDHYSPPNMQERTKTISKMPRGRNGFNSDLDYNI